MTTLSQESVTAPEESLYDSLLRDYEPKQKGFLSFKGRYEALLEVYSESFCGRIRHLIDNRNHLWHRCVEENQMALDARNESDYLRHSDIANALENEIMAADEECEQALRQLELQVKLQEAFASDKQTNQWSKVR